MHIFFMEKKKTSQNRQKRTKNGYCVNSPENVKIKFILYCIKLQILELTWYGKLLESYAPT